MEGTVLYENAQYEEALKEWEKGLKICRALHHHQGEGAFLGNIGRIYYNFGEYQKALENYKKALDIQRSIGDKSGEGASLSNFGALYYTLGDYEKAIDNYEQGLKIEESLGNREIQATILSNIGMVYDERKDYEKALEYYEHALKIQQAARDKKGEGATLTGIASLYGNMAGYPKALDTLKKACEAQRRAKNRSGEGITLTGMGIIYYHLGEYEESIKYHKMALEIFESTGDPDGIFRNLGGMGWTYEKMNRDDEAINSLIKSINILESLRGKTSMEEHKKYFMQDKIVIYEKLVELLIKKERKEEAWSYAERARSKAFLDMLNRHKTAIRSKVKPRTELNQQIANRERDIEWVQKLIKREKQEEKRKELYERLLSLQKKHEDLLKLQIAPDPGTASLMSVQVFSIQEIQQLLDRDSVVLEYFIGREFSCLFAIEKERLSIAGIPCAEEELKNRISTLRTKTIARMDCSKDIKTLSDKLLGNNPVTGLLRAKKKIVIVPHSVLYYLPFCMLVDGDGHYLVEKHQIVTEPSASVWKLCLDEKRNEARSIAAYALGETEASFKVESLDNIAVRGSSQRVKNELPPLPGTRDEVKAIAAFYDDKTVVMGKEMVCANVSNIIQGKSVVHFATHGILNPSEPMLSGLVFSDRILTIEEIFKLDLNIEANVVVLSACNTAGEIVKGDEIVGMSRAFMHAGAPSVMATQWSVSDVSTTLLMKSFYSELKNGECEAEALRKAQLRLMKKYPHPYYWAPFILMGETRSPEGHGEFHSYYEILIPVSVIVTAFSFSIMRRFMKREGG